jgi:tRNA(Ile)-lysidine synthase
MSDKHSKFDFTCTKGFKKIYCGFSGGADSTVLLLTLAEESEKSEFEIEAIHFEHGIRGEASKADAEWCRKFCEIRKIPFRQINLDLLPDCKNLEATARKLRLETWQEIVDPEKEAVAVGQHADDRIENLFLRLMRGSNSTGLTSMRSSQKIGEITFIRPILPLRRVEIEEYLKEHGINDWRTDHTNFENIYRRNYIRNEVLPCIRKEFPDLDKALLKSISALETDADCLENHSLKIYSEIKFRVKDLNRIPLELIENIHPAIQSRFFRYWLTDILEYETIPTADFLNRFNRSLTKYDTKDGRQIQIPLDKDISVVLEKETVSVMDNSNESWLHHTVEWDYINQKSLEWEDYVFNCSEVSAVDDEKLRNQSHNIVFFDELQLPDKLIIRKRIPGDRIVPFGKESEAKVKKLLQDTDLMVEEKKNIPIIADPQGNIIWVPGVRRSNFANISDLTANILRFEYKKVL